ncbi:pelargonidin 3-O-(6-caffeoylglucoside) 5-O-(6-O-malonylglucoside) 4'''-malonyltransferase-like [Cynara cardunculus var. scolymus]|nr:pelargonidin 3-O-(6-caffeoylglucoside) 5-O-(6-O-malonylglucoside) 4'''-malonyltransferase-like [Cynara cardunculus var. scolymus]
MAMKTEIQSRKLIKPSISTPPSLRSYKISFVDELAPSMNISLVLFFPHNTDYNPTQLEKSLEKTLTLMYPLAGRYMADVRTVDCNDQGVEFVQAQADTTIQEILDFKLKVDPNLINQFIPSKLLADGPTDAVLATQLTAFECGGSALGVSIAHRIGDVSTMSAFLNQWATLSRKDAKVETGLITSFSSFPAQDSPFIEQGFTKLNDNGYVTKKLSFDENAISNMRMKATSNGKTDNRQLFKVQLVSALIWKAFIGVDHAIYGHSRDSVALQPTKLRQKTRSSLPRSISIGNQWGPIVTERNTTKKVELGFEDLIDLLGDSVMKTMKEYSKLGHDDSQERKEMVLKSFSQIRNISNDRNVVWLVSWCRFPYYDVDFGFGKPEWISCGCVPFKRGVIMVDDAGGNGVEAYVSMGVADVRHFEQDEDIKAFSV